MKSPLLLGVLVAVLGGSALGPGAGSAEAEAIAVQVGPRWGTVTPGAWTPYVVTLRNEGSNDVEGNVRLVPEQRPPDAGAPVPDPPGTSLPTERFPVHETSLAIAAGTDKTLEFLVVEPPFGYRAELRDRTGATVASARRQPPSAGGASVVLVSDVIGADDRLANLPSPPGQHPVFTRLAGGDLPSDVLSLSGVRAVVVDGSDVGQLRPRQLEALRDFVSLGGRVVLAGGTAGQREFAGLPEELAPLRPTATATVSLAPLGDLARRPIEVDVSVITGDVRRGRSLFDSSEGVPLVVEATYGAGKVVQLTYDLLAEGFMADASLFAAGWGPALAPSLAPPLPPGAGQSTAATSSWAEAWSKGPGAPTGPAWPPYAGVLLIAYLLAAGSLGAVVVWRRRARPWAAMPLLALVFAVAVQVAGRDVTTGRTAVVIEVNTVGASGVVVTEAYHRLSAAGDGFTVEPDLAASTIFTDRFPVAPLALDEPATGGTGGGTLVDGEGAGGLRLAGMGPAVEGTVATLASGRPPLAVTADLRLDGGDGPADAATRLTGRVTNGGTKTLRHVQAQVPRGMQAELVEALGPGQSVDVDARLSWPGPPPHNSNSLVRFAAADRTLAHHGVLAVVAEVEGGPHAYQGVAVVVQAVEPGGVDTGSPVHPILAAPLARGTWLHVYDLVVPGPASPPLLDYPSEGIDQVEVYDWTTGEWRRLPGAEQRFGRNPPPVSLAAGEVVGGVVRVRAEEPPWAPGKAPGLVRLATPGARAGDPPAPR